MSIQVLDEKNRTPLHWAAKQGHLDVCKYLMMNGCDPREKDIDDKSAIDLAENSRLADYLRNKHDKIEIEPASHWDMMRDPKELVGFAKCFAYVTVPFVLSEFIPPWSMIFVWCLVVFLMQSLIRATFSKLTRSETFIGWWWGSVGISYTVWFWFIFRRNSEWLVVSLLLIVVTSVLFYLWFHISASDPGYISFNNGERDEFLKAIEEETFTEKEYCVSCMIKKPLRSKHDPLTKRCIARFDHYCVWMNIPVGYKTHRKFMIFNYLHIICNWSLFFLGLMHLNRQGWSLQTLFYDNAMVTHVLLLYNFMIASMLTKLTYDQTWSWVKNVTTNEFNSRKQSYIIPYRNTVFSMFDDGFTNNAKQFWGEQIKWEQVFSYYPTEYAKKWCQEHGVECPARFTPLGHAKDDFSYLGF